MSKEIDGKTYCVSDLEKTLIDCVVRPSYSGGIHTIINAFVMAREKLNTFKMLTYLQKLSFVYPYHQAIGFYLEHCGFETKDWEIFDGIVKQNKFYLDYNIVDKYLNRRWNIYIPEAVRKVRIARI